MSASATPDARASAVAARRQNWRRAAYRFQQSWLSIVGLAIVVLLFVAAVAGPSLVPYPADIAGGINTATRFEAPSIAHLFGTNELGQDVFTLVIAGARISLLSGVAVVVLGALAGTIVGALAGYYGGWTDEILMRIADLKLTLPSLILAMAVAAALGAGLVNTIIAIALTWWPGYARLVRGEVIAKKEELFVQVAQALGAGTGRILRRHILPNIVSPIIVKMSLDMGFAILTVASLGFIGIGVKPPTPEWGSLLSIARNYMPDYWWTAMFPGLAIFLAVFGFNLLGDGLRDVLDPRARR
ncbi:ABC transporter permease [Limobrevibacterium gyesilva]|uniref:ABC transporter permease n=1 Tax=Limobrevibacterium gyesilva TaxID=2991712 RepID=A0AA41YRI4_9PROT|nr:ABC transporter permease [Limobrevibacterium gyesilva]MCW3477232.1 ABC transporter permease [Limobrevibacterium gyesilva]